MEGVEILNPQDSRKTIMADKLSDEEIGKILDLYEDIGSYAGVAEEVEHSPTTVKKYVEASQDDDVEETEPGETPEGFTAPPPNGAFENQSKSDDVNLAELDYDEFVEYFFTTRGHGVSSNWMQNLMVQCELRQRIPDKDQLLEMMQRGACGLGSAGDQEMVADNYWAVAQRYLKAKSDQNARRGPGGEWVSPTISKTEGDGQSGGSWLGMSQPQQPQQQYGPQGPQGPQGQNVPQGNQSYQQPQFGQQGYPQYQNQQNQQNQQNPYQQNENEELREALQDIRQTQQQLAQAVASQNQGNNLKSQVQELAEVQSTVQQLQNATGSNQEVQAVKQQLATLQQQIAESQNQNNSGNGMESLIQLAAQGDVEPDTLGTLAGVMGVTDPEVKKEEYKMMREDRRMENRKELMDSFMDGVQDLGGGILSSAFQSMGDNGDGSQQNTNANQMNQNQNMNMDQNQNQQNGGVVEPVNQQPQQNFRPPNDYRKAQDQGGVDLDDFAEDNDFEEPAEVPTEAGADDGGPTFDPDDLEAGDEEEDDDE